MTESAVARLRAGRARSELWKVWGPLLALAAVGFIVAVATLDPAPPRQITIATSSPQGAFYAFAERYRDILAAQGYTLEVRETAGSIENLELLRRREVDLALVQGGTAEPGDEQHLRALASLFFEPVWVFHRLAAPPQRIEDFAGRRVAIGAPGSGTRALALELLAANELLDEHTPELVELGAMAAAATLAAGTVEAAFLVASPDAPYVRRLLATPGVELMPIRRHRAYRHELGYLSRVVLGEGVVDLADNVPAYDVPMIAAAASLVATEDLHHALIPLLLEAAVAVHASGDLFAEPGTFPSAELVDLPLASEASRYLEAGPSFLHSWLGFRAASMADRLKILLLPLLTLLFPVFKAAPLLYRWRIRSKIYRWYEDLRLVDDILRGEPSRERVAERIEALRELEQEVTEVSVPLPYMDEFYRLRVHIELILAKLEQLAAQCGEDAEADAEEGG